MTMCLLNDCEGLKRVAPCCLECVERDRCPDRCHKTENTFCIGAIEDDGKGMVEPIQDGMEGSGGR